MERGLGFNPVKGKACHQETTNLKEVVDETGDVGIVIEDGVVAKVN